MIFNIVFGIWAVIGLSGFILAFLNCNEDEDAAIGSIKVFLTSLAVLTIMAIISKFV